MRSSREPRPAEISLDDKIKGVGPFSKEGKWYRKFSQQAETSKETEGDLLSQVKSIAKANGFSYSIDLPSGKTMFFKDSDPKMIERNFQVRLNRGFLEVACRASCGDDQDFMQLNIQLLRSFPEAQEFIPK